MFDQTIVKNESKIVAITKEIEKTISPDKVTEMYDAIKEEVEKNIIKKLRIESNNLNGIIELQKDINTESKVVRTHFNINGKDYFDSSLVLADEEKAGEIDKLYLIEKLQKHYANVVAGLLMETTMRTVFLKNK